MMGWLLRHARDEDVPPRHKLDGSLGAEIAFAFLLQRHVFRPGDSPRTLYDAFMLQEKDRGCPRFQVLVRYPTHQEKDDEAAERYIFNRGELAGQILLRVRSVQGHSGEAMKSITRVGQVLVEKKAVPLILIHSTPAENMDRSLVKGLLPGGPRHERVDNFFVEPEGFAKKVAQAKARHVEGPCARFAHEDKI